MNRKTLSYGRQAALLLLAPVPNLITHAIPFVLLIVLALTALQVVERAKDGFSTASKPAMEVLGAVNADPDLALFTPGVRSWTEHILRWSAEYQLPAPLVAIVMQIESCGSPHVRSSAGAIGLFQVMPFHFSPGEATFDPEVNAARGLSYLRQAYEMSDGSIARTLAGYNGGLSRISALEASWPEETQRYVAWGTGIWDDLQSDGQSSVTLDRWLAVGGAHLCDQGVDGK